MCHRQLDSDIGESDLNSLPASGTVPTSTAILSTSPGKYPILWRVVGFTFTHRESTLKLRTIVLGSYLDCTGCNRILHLQGLPNCEYDPAYPFTVKTLAIPLGIPVAVGWISQQRRPCFRLAQSHCESVSVSTRIPNTIGRGFCTRLPV